MSSSDTVLYMKGDRDVEVSKPDVFLKDIVSTECTDKAALSKIRAIKVLKLNKKGKQRQVISILRIISLVHELFPAMEIQNLGETDILVTYEDQKTPSMAWHVIKTALVAAVTFCGAAFSIMAFNNDVDVTKLFSQIYALTTGQETDGFTVLEISYSIGVTAGILVFFNHFGKKRFTVDPTPMEVQMRLYENDIQTTLIEDAARKGEEQDVDMGSADSSGIRRS